MKVCETSFENGGCQCLVKDDYIMLIDMQDGLPFIRMRPYANKEFKTPPHIIMTSDMNWNPSRIDSVISQRNDWRQRIAWSMERRTPAGVTDELLNELRDPEQVIQVHRLDTRTSTNRQPKKGNGKTNRRRNIPAPSRDSHLEYIPTLDQLQRECNESGRGNRRYTALKMDCFRKPNAKDMSNYIIEDPGKDEVLSLIHI